MRVNFASTLEAEGGSRRPRGSGIVRTKPMDPQATYDALVDDLVARNADVETAKMMGMPSVKRNGKLVAGFWKDSMTFKLPDEAERSEALALEGAALFDPSERGRPMKEWVAVPATQADRWPDLARRALGLG